MRDGLGALPCNVWLTVEFGYDAELFRRMVHEEVTRPLPVTVLDGGAGDLVVADTKAA